MDTGINTVAIEFKACRFLFGVVRNPTVNKQTQKIMPLYGIVLQLDPHRIFQWQIEWHLLKRFFA